MAFRMPGGVKKALMGMGVSGKDYKIIRNNMADTYKYWDPKRYGGFDNYINDYVTKFGDYLKGNGSASAFNEIEQDAGNWLEGTSYEKGLADRLAAESQPKITSTADNGPKLLPSGKGDINNNPVQQIVREQNNKTPSVNSKILGSVNKEVPASNDSAMGVINEGGTPSGSGSINYSVASSSGAKTGGVVNSTVPANGPQGVANTKIAAENGTGGTINAGGTAKDAGPNAINHTTAAPTSNPGPDGISFNSPSGGGTGTINGGVSTSGGAATSGGVSNTQVSFGEVGKQSGPSVNPKKTGPAYDFEQFQGKYRPSSGGKMNAAERYMTKSRWDEINDDFARMQEAKKAGNMDEFNSIAGKYNGQTTRRGLQDFVLNKMQKEGPGISDYVWGYKMPQTVVGAGLVFGLGSEIVGANNGQKSNAELYSTPM